MAVTNIAGKVNIAVQGSESISTGQTTATTTAGVVNANAACREVIIQSDIANTVNILIGNSANQFLVLEPGDSITIPIANVNLVYVRSASLTAVVNWFSYN